MKNIAFLRASSILLALASCSGVADLALAQTPISTCQPPQQNEYLLLVPTPTKESQQQLQQTLPTNTRSTVCRYQDDTVTRIGGFRRIEDANDWVRYVKEIVGLSAYVVQPTAIAVATAPSTNIPAFNPKPLGEGYAVLVDFFNKPEVAAQLRQILGNDVGLVSFGKRPYLLAMYTTSEGKANSTLRQLSDRGFWSMMVDSRRVTLLKPVVSF
ncbi:MAG: hypothetical protein AB1589_14925 [Cyanobacteriota bacterium]